MGKLALRDLNYFGTAWYTVESKGPNAAFVLGNGYANAHVVRNADGLFSAGIVERLDAAGNVTDVVLAFAGTQPSDPLDVLTDLSIVAGLPDAQLTQAAALFDSLMADPRYANATIHVTGHSLGGWMTEYVLGHALTTYDHDTLRARVDFTAFAAPPHGVAMAARFGLTVDDFAGWLDDYTVSNDVTQLLGTASYLGTTHFLATYQPYGPLGFALNAAAAHHPSAFLGGLGLPDWLTAAQKAAVIGAVIADANDLLYDPNYGSTGPVAQHVVGSSAADAITGTAQDDVIAGNGGADLLTGGAGADRFVYAQASDSLPGAIDHILDFRHADGDRIDLSAIDARLGLIGNQAFSFIGDAAFTHTGQLSIHVVDGVTYVSGNISGDSAPEFTIAVHADQPLTASDFIL